jgi:hypothetical protein
MSDADQTIGTARATSQSSVPVTKLGFLNKVGSRTEVANNEFVIFVLVSPQIARSSVISSFSTAIVANTFNSKVGSRAETALTEFNIAVLNSPQVARGTVSGVDYRRFVGYSSYSFQTVEG